jgi:myo-inositol 2-dehydrogenase / D-chiro-inositol 1-dehydrogenase
LAAVVRAVSDVFSHSHSVNSCHMANIAMLLDRSIKFDPEKYDFIDDPQASRLMRREQRAPYQITV